MIKINLLPSKKKPAKKLTDLQQQMIYGAAILVVVLLAMAYLWKRQTDRIAELERAKSAAEAKIQQQDNLLKEVKNVEDERKKVAEKIEIIEKLKKNQAGPVRLLDEISKALPQGVNILSLTEADSNVNLEGTAFANEDIVKFVDRLKSSPLLAGVTLMESVQTKLENVDVYKYKLQFAYKGL